MTSICFFFIKADKFKGASNPKTKLQPQRRKQPAAPGSDGSSEINRTEMLDHETEGNLSKSDFEVISNSKFFFFELLSFLNNFLFSLLIVIYFRHRPHFQRLIFLIMFLWTHFFPVVFLLQFL
jgi:hypothetical protein